MNNYSKFRLNNYEFISNDLNLKFDDLPKINTYKKTIKILIYRNFMCELIVKHIDIYLKLFGLKINWIYSEYDDTINIKNIKNIDFILVLYDFENLKLSKKKLSYWIHNKIIELQNFHKKDIRCIFLNKKISLPFLDIKFKNFLIDINLNKIKKNKKFNLVIDNKKNIFGTRLSYDFQKYISKFIAKLLIKYFIEEIKMIIVDLDFTLYKGVLSEDGPSKISINQSNENFIDHLISLERKGIIIAICSKNKIGDYNKLRRNNNIIQNFDKYITYKEINWEPKSFGINKILKKANINSESVLFIDDNSSELMNVNINFPKIHLLQATENFKRNLYYLKKFPLINTYNIKSNYVDRTRDLKAKEIRKKISNNQNNVHYELKTKIIISIAKSNFLERAFEISKKTNQFNLNTKRLSKNEIKNYLSYNKKCIISFSLIDKLSNSGNIAAFFCELRKKKIYVNESCISCRALGRDLEETIIYNLLVKIRSYFYKEEIDSINILYQLNDRNSLYIKKMKTITNKFYGKKLEKYFSFTKNYNLTNRHIKIINE